jgi:hypothetical protein
LAEPFGQRVVVPWCSIAPSNFHSKWLFNSTARPLVGCWGAVAPQPGVRGNERSCPGIQLHLAISIAISSSIRRRDHSLGAPRPPLSKFKWGVRWGDIQREVLTSNSIETSFQQMPGDLKDLVETSRCPRPPGRGRCLQREVTPPKSRAICFRG